MKTHNDFEEFLQLLGEENVEFVIVGGYAVAFHGYVRATNGLDVFFRISPENIESITRALNRFGIATDGLRSDELAEPGGIIRMGMPSVRIELINTISGVSFQEVWDRRVPGRYGDVTVSFISLQDLIKNTKSAGCPKDVADVDELGG